MTSQRDREQRIVERLQAGALELARPSDVARPTPGEDAPCRGCLEPHTDARVGEQHWHALCVLFWKGRSETLRDQRIPHTQPGTGVTPARARWVIVVPVDRADTYTALRRNFARSPWVDVIFDRRRGERRDDGSAVPEGERRRSKRRKTSDRDPGPTPDPVFRLAHQVDGCEVYESTGPELGRCPECGAMVSVELPRFVEPPVRLEIVVRHEPAPERARHIVELQSFSPTGRALLATRLAGRTHPNPSTSDRPES
jgi:hypothetical protein